MKKAAYLFGCFICAVPGAVHGQDAVPASAQNGDGARRDADIVVYGRAIEQIGIAQSGSQGVVGYRDFQDRPISRVGELVENVPGVIATQHSGTGKANQYFLRGFNLDHGTDFAGYIDGVPINMRSHGHGQGYLDLNFIIPELMERIDYRKGPYFADVGDFSAAGTIAFKSYDALAPIAQVQLGQYGYYRALAAGSTAVGAGTLLLGGEAVFSNGPWDLDENLRKYNGFAKYGVDVGSGRVGLSLSGYDARWNATDQVPARAVADGRIGRFGNIDSDLGGSTTRIGANLQGDFGRTTANVYATWYDFNLTSNFTYFLDDPVNGDQFQQADRRSVFGGNVRHAIAGTLGSMPVNVTLGGDVRYDAIARVGLYRSIRGQRSSTVREDQVDQFSAGAYAQAELKITPKLRATVGLRGDVYSYQVDSDLPVNSGSGSDAILGPKLSLAWQAAKTIELYANYGESFHSNDVRGATVRVDPASGLPAEQVDVLPRARGAELGARLEQGPIVASVVGFYLKLDSELVFVGDAGGTEPNAASRRWGGEATIFWRVNDIMRFDMAATATRARFATGEARQNFIPGAVSNVVAAGVSIDLPSGLSASARVRHFGGAPLIEDGSQRSDGTTLVNLGAYYRTGRVRIGLDLFNLFNSKDADITYFYGSRLPGEAADGVEDQHFHPAEPRQLRASVQFTW